MGGPKQSHHRYSGAMVELLQLVKEEKEYTLNLE